MAASSGGSEEAADTKGPVVGEPGGSIHEVAFDRRCVEAYRSTWNVVSRRQDGGSAWNLMRRLGVQSARHYSSECLWTMQIEKGIVWEYSDKNFVSLALIR